MRPHGFGCSTSSQRAATGALPASGSSSSSDELGAAERHARTRSGKYGGESRKPIRERAAGAACAICTCRADAVRRDEPERARRVVVAAAGDEHLAEPAERRAARAPVRERQQRMVRAPVAVGRDRLRVRRGRRAPPRASGRRRAPTRRGSRGRSRGTAAGSDARTAARTDGRGSRRRRRRPGTRPARAAAPARARGTRRAAGSAARAAGTASCPGMPRQSASSGSPSDRARSSVPRSSASACATDGGPENAAEMPREAGIVAEHRGRRTEPGIAPKTCRTGERDEPLDRLLLVRDSRAACRSAAAA